MSQPAGPADQGSEAIRLGFERQREEFRQITRRARRRFEERDWHGAQRDAFERLEIRRRVVREVLDHLRAVLGPRLENRSTWAAMKAAYARSILGWADVEIAETFFNSVTRQVFSTVGVDRRVEFIDLDFERAHHPTWTTIHRSYVKTTTTRALLREILGELPFEAPWRDLEGDAALAAERVDAAWRQATRGRPLESVAVIDALFYRGSAAYLVGRIRGGISACPILIALTNSARGIEVDTVLSTEAEVSVVFSFTRSYFLVDLPCPSQVVRLLRLVMPRKPIADLYISLGYNKHGKTEMYRSLLAHMEGSTERFDLAPGDPGMVMLVFAMPTHEYVFKIIRDRFAYPKTSTREDVLRCYELVFKHDRAGRLVDAQEFEHLSFDRERFSPRLLEELATSAADSVTLDQDSVTLQHLYIERRVRPLNLFLREAERNTAGLALLDYGQAIRDLAAANIFPGDLLLKNFGVTRHGRVIFYDYDELCHVTDCHFRDLPSASHGDEELAAEPWYYVDERDVFPEEFLSFLGLSPEQRELYLAHHTETLTAAWWRDIQARHRAGEVLDIFPYAPAARLRPDRARAGEPTPAQGEPRPALGAG